MSSVKLILKNVRKNIRDYLVYFLTLMLSVSLFYAFNSIADQSAFAEIGATKELLYEQLGILLSMLSVVIAAVLAFLVIYANGFLLRRRKKELGIYMVLGMKKGRISRIFAGETLCVGLLSLAVGILPGVAFSQVLSLVSLKLFAVDMTEFGFVFSVDALEKTAVCFAVIFGIVMIFNVWSISGVKLIDLLRAGRKNENVREPGRIVSAVLFFLAAGLMIFGCTLFWKNGLLPQRDSMDFQVASAALAVGTVLFFYTAATVILSAVRMNDRVYLRGLNTFLVRQVGSRIHTNYITIAVVCGLLTVTICTVSAGVSTAIAMNDLSEVSTPYDLNVLSDVEIDGDSNVADYLLSQGIDMESYAEEMEQITLLEADLTYGDLFEGQKLNLWQFDAALPEVAVNAVSLSDFNRALAMQGKAPVSLNEDEYLLNCNYEGTIAYVERAYKEHPTLTVAGNELKRASAELLHETFFMTQVGNNDRGTLILPDSTAQKLEKDMNILLVKYREQTDSDEVLQKLIPIGLDESHGYRYTEKNMMYDMYYGSSALLVFLCCYIGLVFLMICAALLALKQLTETADNVYRYTLIRKLGADDRQIDRTVFFQTAVFFAAPLVVAGVFSAVLLRKAIEMIEEFMNIHISSNVVFTVVLFLVVYGGYFLAAYLSCRRMVREQRKG
ncbi:permease, domain protein [Lachnoclostridium sp. An169]|uniref:ABC transporter permease n=1 Tax=Lachnoclostridium sp. An169 TaxID=1965569 RepID=UPI000B368E76|nr:ABC transporter permease [Lachnoclostridium sp. An169]OUP81009.1 permease, domain protein [Lachnoclostridium sp. An169]